jgi:hypothetical protein
MVRSLPRQVCSITHKGARVWDAGENIEFWADGELSAQKTFFEWCFSMPNLSDIGGQQEREMCTYWPFAGDSKVLDHPGIIVARGWYL